MFVLLLLVMLLLLWFIDMIVIEPRCFLTRHIHCVMPLRKSLIIVQFSDTHFHNKFSGKQLKKRIAAINACHPDIVIFSGDLMDHYHRAQSLRYRLPPYLRQIQAKKAKLAVYGNHDIGGGAKYVYADMLKESGFCLLCNQHMCFPEADLCIMGIDDPLAGYEDRTITDARYQSCQILISHEPDIIDQLAMDNIDLTISGHTHGGQIYLPGITQALLPKGGRHYRKGCYVHHGHVLYVSSGWGMTRIPLRLANPPEIIVYHLHPRS